MNRPNPATGGLFRGFGVPARCRSPRPEAVMADESTTTSGEQTQATTDQRDGDDDEGEPLQDAAKLLDTLRKERAARKSLEREVKPLRTYKQQSEDAAK